MTPTKTDHGTQTNSRSVWAPPVVPAANLGPVPVPPVSTVPASGVPNSSGPPQPPARPRSDSQTRTFYVGSSRRVGPVLKALAVVLGLVLLFAGVRFVTGDGTGQGVGVTAQGQPAYKNGQIPAGDLVGIDGDFQLLPQAAAAFKDLRGALAAAGHETTVNSAYRDVALQEELVAKYGLLADGGTAAPVGESEHGLGATVDLTLDYEALAWMRAHAGDYGFKETIDTEPWHWTFVQ